MPTRRVRCPECDKNVVSHDQTGQRDLFECPNCGYRFSLGRKDVDDSSPSSRPSRESGRERKRRKRQTASGSKTLLFLLAGIGLLILVVVVGGVVFLIRSFRPEDEPSPVPLMQARAGHKTRLIVNENINDGPAESPPPGPVQLIRYPSTLGPLAAYCTRDPQDGRKHPAIVWAHGGFGGIDPQWEDSDPPEIFRKAGLVVMSPSWRGENDNPGSFEMFYGEIDDAVAAVEYVSKLSYVDPKRIYFAGHSTGGTITLLSVEATDKLRAAFSFGGAPDIGNVLRQSFGLGYGNTPFDWRDKKERRLRSAIDFIGHVRAPTFYFEGEEDGGYIIDARKMEKIAKGAGAPVHVTIIKNGDHFDIVEPLCRLIARKIAADTGPTCNITITDAEAQRAFAQNGP